MGYRIIVDGRTKTPRSYFGCQAAPGAPGYFRGLSVIRQQSELDW